MIWVNGYGEEEARSWAEDLFLVLRPCILPLQELCSTYQAALLSEIRALHPQHRTPGQPPDHLPLAGERKGRASFTD